MKPFNGRIQNWFRVETGKPDTGLGYVIIGEFVDHPTHGGRDGHTSYVVAHDLGTGEIETRNSRYKLIGVELSLSPAFARNH